MSLYTASCPRCGRKHRYPIESARTVATCETCGLRYELPEPVLHVAGWLGLIGAVLVLGSCTLVVGTTLYPSIRAWLQDEPVAEESDAAAPAPSSAPELPRQPGMPFSPGLSMPPSAAQPQTPGPEQSTMRRRRGEPGRVRDSARRPPPTAARPKLDREQRAQSRLRLARRLMEEGRKDKAVEWLEQLIKDYPDTRAAVEARQLLKEVKG